MKEKKLKYKKSILTIHAKLENMNVDDYITWLQAKQLLNNSNSTFHYSKFQS